jgi:hypothetical protein
MVGQFSPSVPSQYFFSKHPSKPIKDIHDIHIDINSFFATQKQAFELYNCGVKSGGKKKTELLFRKFEGLN